MIWLRRNLFRNPADGAVSVVVGALAAYLLYRAARFVLVTGRWDVVRDNLRLLMVGRYPTVHLPRVAVSVVIAAAVTGVLAGIVTQRRLAAGTTDPRLSRGERVTGLLRRFGPGVVVVLLVLALCDTAGPWLTAGGAAVALTVGHLAGSRLPRPTHRFAVGAAVVVPFVLVAYLADGAGWDAWGGLMLNVFIAVVSIVLCFPVGVLAALARRSRLPLLRVVATFLIEVVRGVPLFVLLLMANVALGFFVPPSVAPSDLARSIVVFTIFTGAYLAEIIRGGLQSLPPGQEEAGRALGLPPTRLTFLIVLPQALRNVIPAQVGQFISLFKDTTLAGAAMGLFEMLQVGQAITRQGPFAGQLLLPETFAFVGLLFWVFCSTMSRESQRLEARLGVGVR